METRSKKRSHACDNLHSVMKEGSVERIRTLIYRQADVNELDKDGCSPLVHAAFHNRAPEVLETLIDAKADPNLRSGDATGTSPDVWAELLERGPAREHADVWSQMFRRRPCHPLTCSQLGSPLTLATLRMSPANVKILIKARAEVNFMNVHQDRSSTALFLAVEMGSTDIVKLLVKAKAVLDVLNQNAYTVLDVAERKGHHDIAKLLLDAGAPRGMRWRMQQACIHGRADEVKLLLDAGYLLHLQDSYSQMPLVLAVQHGHANIAQMLIDAGADVNVSDYLQCLTGYSRQRRDIDLDRSGMNSTPHSLMVRETPLCVVVERGDVNAARLIIDAKADMNLPGNAMSLARAAEKGQPDMVKLLLDAKAHVDVGNGIALSCAARSGNTEAVQILLDAKASPESDACYKDSPLTLAISGGHAPAVTALLAAKAPVVSPPDIDDPIILAVKLGKTDIMKIMIDANAPLEAAAGKSSPLRVAIDNMKLDAMRVLLEAKAATDIPGTEYAVDLLSRALSAGMQYQNDSALRLLLDTYPYLASKQHCSRLLSTAYQKRYFSALQLMLDKGISADEATVDGVPIFYQAVSDHTTPVVKMMIDTKANVNVRGPEGASTPLILACRQRYRDIVELLLEATAILDATDCNGHTALRHAVDALQGPPADETIVKMLLDAKADLHVKNRQDSSLTMSASANKSLNMNVHQDKSVLFPAVEMGSLNIVRLLVEAKAVLDVLDHEAYTVLDVAEDKRYHDIAQLLLDAGAPRGMRWRMQRACIQGRSQEVKLLLDAGYPLQFQNAYSQHPLELTVHLGRTDIAQILIAARAQVNVPDTSLLLVSVYQNNVVLVRSLVTAQADVNVRDDVHCPITYSIQRGDLELTKSLIDARADVDLTPLSSAKTALCVAAERGDINAARLLIDAKANLHHIANQMTPLASAADKGQPDMVRLLLHAKTPVDGENGLAMLCAARSGQAEAVRILLDAKASLESRDRSGRSPLTYAISCGQAHVVTFLLTAKAALVSPSKIDDALTVASESDNTDIMKMLIDAKAPLETAAGKRSPRLAAMKKHNLQGIRLLLEAKATTDIPGTKYADTILSHALDMFMRSQDDTVLRLLLDANPSLVSNPQSSGFLGPLYKQQRFSTVQLLLEKRASVDNAGVDGVLILSRAVSDHMTQLVKLIIDAKANVNLRSLLDHPPLIIATRRRYGDIVRMLLEAKATLDAKDCLDRTALRHATHAYDGSPVDESIVRMLLDAKAPLERSDLSYAVYCGQSAVVKILVDAKADLRVKEGYNTPLLMEALEAKSESIVKILLTADPYIFDECDSNGMTSLMFAIKKYGAPRDARNVRMLLKHAWAYCAAQSSDEPPAKRFKRTE